MIDRVTAYGLINRLLRYLSDRGVSSIQFLTCGVPVRMSNSVLSAVCGFMLLQLLVGYGNPLTLPKSLSKLALDPEVDYDAVSICINA